MNPPTTQRSILDDAADQILEESLGEEERAWLFPLWLAEQLPPGQSDMQQLRESLPMLREVYASAWAEFVNSWIPAQKREWSKAFVRLHEQRGAGRVVGVSEVTESQEYRLEPATWLYLSLRTQGEDDKVSS